MENCIVNILTVLYAYFVSINKKVAITDNKLEDVHSSLFKNLPALVTLDLQRNNLQTIAQAFVLGKNFTDLFLLGKILFELSFF